METSTSGSQNIFTPQSVRITPPIPVVPSPEQVGFADKVLWNNGANVVKDFQRMVADAQFPFADQADVDKAFFFFVAGMTNTVNAAASFNKEFIHG